MNANSVESINNSIGFHSWLNQPSLLYSFYAGRPHHRRVRTSSITVPATSPKSHPLHGSRSRYSGSHPQYSVPSPPFAHVPRVPGHSPESLANPCFWFVCLTPACIARTQCHSRTLVGTAHAPSPSIASGVRLTLSRNPSATSPNCRANTSCSSQVKLSSNSPVTISLTRIPIVPRSMKRSRSCSFMVAHLDPCRSLFLDHCPVPHPALLI